MSEVSHHPAFRITTSWDDGHPLDLRLAEMLNHHSLAATFYIPRTCPPRPTLDAARIRELSTRFEIGAHTIDHVFLTEAEDAIAKREIIDSKEWVEDVTGKPCRMFCPPAGKFAARHVGWMTEAGYAGYRTVELLSLSHPRERGGLLELPTSVHAFPHGRKTYAKNALRRRSPGNLWRCITHGGGEWRTVAQSLLETASRTGGHFHLWGHSWELEETQQWDRLDQVLVMLGEYANPSAMRTNGQLCEPRTEVTQAVKPSLAAGR